MIERSNDAEKSERPYWFEDTPTLDPALSAQLPEHIPTPAQPAVGCGDPSCKDPNCDYGKHDDCSCVGAVIGQHDRSCRFASQPSPAAPVETKHLQCERCGEVAIATGTLCDDCAELLDPSAQSRCSAGNAGAEEAIRDWWYSDRREPMTSKEAAKSLIWYLAKCGLKIIRDEPQEVGMRDTMIRGMQAAFDEVAEYLEQQNAGGFAAHIRRRSVSLSRPQCPSESAPAASTPAQRPRE